MSDDFDSVTTEPQPAPISHRRILWIMGLVVVLASVAGLVFISRQFGAGVLLGGVLSFINYYWLKVSLKRLFDNALAHGEKPRFLAVRYFGRYLTLGAILTIVFLTHTIPVVAVIAGLSSFALAIVIEEGGGHHEPLIVEFINHYLGEPVYHFQINYVRPYFWDKILLPFGVRPESLFGEYTPENAIPWYTIMFVIACVLTVIVVWIFKGKLSAEDPSNGQLTLESGILALRGLVVSVIGEHGFKYFPVVGAFAVLVLISNLMGLFPLFMSPTASINVTLALGISSFIYYNYVGISENGLLAHLGHLTGPRLPLLLTLIITPLIFLIELFSNLIRPMTLGIRLFANMFADEQIAAIISGLFPPFTQILVPVVLLPLALFVALVQTLVFTLLSMIYISEVSHAPHDEAHKHENHMKETGETAQVEYA